MHAGAAATVKIDGIGDADCLHSDCQTVQGQTGDVFLSSLGRKPVQPAARRIQTQGRTGMGGLTKRTA